MPESFDSCGRNHGETLESFGEIQRETFLMVNLFRNENQMLYLSKSNVISVIVIDTKE